MVNFKIATGPEQPINRHGAVGSVKMSQGDTVGLDANGDIVQADGAAATAIPALGIAMAEVRSLADYTDGPEKLAAQANYVLTEDGKRVEIVTDGVEVENNDGDSAFTPGEPVLLAPGGGFTQTEPVGASGDVRQVLGVALTANRIRLDVNPDYTIA